MTECDMKWTPIGHQILTAAQAHPTSSSPWRCVALPPIHRLSLELSRVMRAISEEDPERKGADHVPVPL